MRPIYITRSQDIFVAAYNMKDYAGGPISWDCWPGFAYSPAKAVNMFIRKLIEKEGGPVI